MRSGTAGDTLRWAAKEMDDTTTPAKSTGVDKDQCCEQATGSTEAPVAPRQKDYDRNDQPAEGMPKQSSASTAPAGRPPPKLSFPAARNPVFATHACAENGSWIHY